MHMQVSAHTPIPALYWCCVQSIGPWCIRCARAISNTCTTSLSEVHSSKARPPQGSTLLLHQQGS
jgi:hypothetical protein